MCNKYGDFKIAQATKNRDGTITWTKHYSVLECWQDEKKIFFLKKANNRTSHPHEVILDFDNNPTPQQVEKIYEELTKKHSSWKIELYHSGSRGYHIHITIIPSDNEEFYFLQKKESMNKIRNYLIKKYSCDTTKISDKTMIALEHEPHYKTGKLKTLLKKNY